MRNFWRSILFLGVVICLQALVYLIFIKPNVASWGATDEEVHMSFVGDELSPRINSTRAVEINATANDVWKLIIQLGADRGGSFSYTFLEKAMGYKGLDSSDSLDKSYDMKVGRIIPGSSDPSSSVIEYNFEVLAVDEGTSFVLKNWGAFVLRVLDKNTTRFIIRNHGAELNGLAARLGDFIMTPLHYLMERRMMLEFKSLAETRKGLSQSADIIWFCGIVLSMIGCFGLIVQSRLLRERVVAALLSVAWLWPLLVLNPIPTYSIGFSGLVFAAVASHYLIPAVNRCQTIGH